jgi:GNAT superfamily N-acetyltransferase
VRDFAVSYLPKEEIFQRSFADLLGRPDTLVLVAEGGGSILGYLLAGLHGTLFADGPMAWVEELMVAEPARGSGVGRSLMTAAEQWAHSVPCAYLALASRRAGRFYEALGYEPSATYYRKAFSSLTPGSAPEPPSSAPGGGRRAQP